MSRSELKKKAQAHLHGYYGNWSWIALLPCVALFIYLLFTIIFFQSSTGVMDSPNDYNSWQDDYTKRSDRSTSQYQKGYEAGYSDGYDDGAYQVDSYDYGDEGGNNGNNLNSLSNTSSIVSLKNTTREVTYQQTTSIKTSISSFFVFLFSLIAILAIILYRGMIQWAAVDNVEGREFNLKSVFTEFVIVNGKRTVVANILVTLYTFLWSLLFIIPGVIKQLSYGMTNYLLKKDPILTAKEAMALSQELMKGYKLEYLIFSYSFILWQIAVSFSFGLVSVYVIPYYGVTEAMFFDQIIEGKHYLFSQEKEAGFVDF